MERKIWTRAMLLELAELGVGTMFVSAGDEPMRQVEELRAVGVEWWSELKNVQSEDSGGGVTRWRQASGTFVVGGRRLSINLSTDHVKEEKAA